ncbi:hypothetical protein DFP72DRAFT_1134359 [Ephemerocybe angulata]|uniref:Uncharacterized protein n=1 Tax=Ephemerocybe angulata TaxID=980116 RepID=A0A8H6HSK2_9AGAR|nr:hypothetical protein DFP72DRAFT_1134359 [Tulosesus angulatus]
MGGARGPAGSLEREGLESSEALSLSGNKAPGADQPSLLSFPRSGCVGGSVGPVRAMAVEGVIQDLGAWKLFATHSSLCKAFARSAILPKSFMRDLAIWLLPYSACFHFRFMHSYTLANWDGSYAEKGAQTSGMTMTSSTLNAGPSSSLNVASTGAGLDMGRLQAHKESVERGRDVPLNNLFDEDTPVTLASPAKKLYTSQLGGFPPEPIASSSRITPSRVDRPSEPRGEVVSVYSEDAEGEDEADEDVEIIDLTRAETLPKHAPTPISIASSPPLHSSDNLFSSPLSGPSDSSMPRPRKKKRICFVGVPSLPKAKRKAYKSIASLGLQAQWDGKAYQNETSKPGVVVHDDLSLALNSAIRKNHDSSRAPKRKSQDDAAWEAPAVKKPRPVVQNRVEEREAIVPSVMRQVDAVSAVKKPRPLPSRGTMPPPPPPLPKKSAPKKPRGSQSSAPKPPPPPWTYDKASDSLCLLSTNFFFSDLELWMNARHLLPAPQDKIDERALALPSRPDWNRGSRLDLGWNRDSLLSCFPDWLCFILRPPPLLTPERGRTACPATLRGQGGLLLTTVLLTTGDDMGHSGATWDIAGADIDHGISPRLYTLRDVTVTGNARLLVLWHASIFGCQSSGSNVQATRGATNRPIPSATILVAGIVAVVTSSKWNGGEPLRPYAATPLAGTISVDCHASFGRVVPSVLAPADRLTQTQRSHPSRGNHFCCELTKLASTGRLPLIQLLATPLTGFNYIVFSRNWDVATHFGFSVVLQVARRTRFCCVFAVPAIKSSLSHHPSHGNHFYRGTTNRGQQDPPIATVRFRSPLSACGTTCSVIVLSAYGRFRCSERRFPGVLLELARMSERCVAFDVHATSSVLTSALRLAFDARDSPEKTRTPRGGKLSASEASTRGKVPLGFHELRKIELSVGTRDAVASAPHARACKMPPRLRIEPLRASHVNAVMLDCRQVRGRVVTVRNPDVLWPGYDMP